MITESYSYLFPYIHCTKCGEEIHLPYPNLPLEHPDSVLGASDTYPPQLPSEIWHAWFACRECGRTDTYTARHILFDGTVDKPRIAPYYDDATVFLVEFECERRDCAAPAKLHIDMRTATSPESDLRDLIRRGYFYGTLPCGHAIQRRFQKFPRLSRVIERLW